MEVAQAQVEVTITPQCMMDLQKYTSIVTAKRNVPQEGTQTRG